MNPTNDILHEYLQITNLISKHFRVYFDQLHLTYPQSIVLAILDVDGPMTISALSEASGSAISTISGVLDRLEAMDLVQRSRSDADRRVTYVSVTDRVREYAARARSSAAEQFEQVLGTLSPEELETVHQGFDLLRRALHDFEA